MGEGHMILELSIPHNYLIIYKDDRQAAGEGGSWLIGI